MGSAFYTEPTGQEIHRQMGSRWIIIRSDSAGGWVTLVDLVHLVGFVSLA